MDKNLIQRSITGSIFVVVVVGMLWLSVWTMGLLLLTICILALTEFYRLSEKAGAQPQKIYATITGACIFALIFLQFPFYVFIIPFFFIIFFIELYRKKENPFGNIAWTILGLIYIVAPLCLLSNEFAPRFWSFHYFDSELGSAPYNPAPIISFFVLIWISDTID